MCHIYNLQITKVTYYLTISNINLYIYTFIQMDLYSSLNILHFVQQANRHRNRAIECSRG